MPSLRYTLSNNGVVTGAYSVPTASASTLPDQRPLVVGLHGGGYDHQYFEATPKYSAAKTANGLGVPFVAIDRPCYGGTTSIFPPPENTTFPHETGTWLHRYILPKLWTEIGLPNRCTCIVLLCHSLGVMGGIVAASLHAQDPAPAYPLGGIIASGLGDKQSTFMTTTQPENVADRDNYSLAPVALKDKLMFKPGTVESEVLEQSERLNAPSPSHITKEDFLPAFSAAFRDAMTEKNIQGGFRGAGLMPHDPEAVLSKLDVKLKTPTPPGSSHGLPELWTSQTPTTAAQACSQSDFIKSRISRHKSSSPSSILDAVDFLAKGTRGVMHQIALLKSENAILREENATLSRRRRAKKVQLRKGGSLTLGEGQDQIAQREVDSQVKEETRQNPAPSTRAAPKKRSCGVCGKTGHNARTCQQVALSSSDSEE